MRWLPVLSLLLASCSSDSVEVGIIHFYGESEDVIDAPETVDVGERFSVTVNTYGGGCTSAEWMAVEQRHEDGGRPRAPGERGARGAVRGETRPGGGVARGQGEQALWRRGEVRPRRAVRRWP